MTSRSSPCQSHPRKWQSFAFVTTLLVLPMFASSAGGLAKASEESQHDPNQLSVVPADISSSKHPSLRSPSNMTSSEADVFSSSNLWSSSSCASLTDCSSCSNTYTCHWCAKDQACHARGSIHGCSWGVTCHDPKKKNATGCASHATCSECALSSHLCHWCEHDDACHAVGSAYGCAAGVNCYSNDRCRRKESEHYPKYIFTELAPFGVLLIGLIGFSYFCMASCCFSRVIKNLVGAYNDIADPLLNSVEETPNEDVRTPGLDGHSIAESDHRHALGTNGNTEGLGVPQQIGGENGLNTAQATHEVKAMIEDQQSEYVELEGLIRQDQELAAQNGSIEQDDMNVATPLLGSSVASSRAASEVPEVNSVAATRASSSHSPGRRSFSSPHMRSFFRCCQVMHCINLLLIFLATIAAIHYFPKMPSYNVCNDSVAWKAIMDSIASLKLDASFEILISVDNPNHIDVMLEHGSGVFRYKNKPAGTFSLPSNLNIEGMAVTDLMVDAQIELSSDKYQAMELAADYYRGKLVLVVDFDAHLNAVGIPYTLKIRNRDVYVNELSDRSLCACPSWDDPKPSNRMLEERMPWEDLLEQWKSF